MEHTFPLTSLRLRFTVQAESDLFLGGWRAGSNFRGALLQVMNRATCVLSSIPISQREDVDPQHVASCPVCWLARANEHPGKERRGYALSPPLQSNKPYGKGDSFSFHLTLFGNAIRYLPYFILAIPETGRIGIGPGRGRFTLLEIHAEQSPPIVYQPETDWTILKQNDNLVRPPQNYISHSQLTKIAHNWLDGCKKRTLCLSLTFKTPLRLIWEERLVKTADFVILFTRLLERLDMLAVQFSGAEHRPPQERKHLYDLAAYVRLVDDRTKWVDVKSGSRRTGKETWVSGLVGEAYYSAPLEIWYELLPWLIWGELVQVGKDVVKGNGVFRISKEANE